MTSISGNLDPAYLQNLDHSIQDWSHVFKQTLKTRWVSVLIGSVALTGGLALLLEGQLVQLLLMLMVLSCIGLMLTMTAYLNHLNQQKVRIQELLDQAQALEIEMSRLRKRDQDKNHLISVLAHDLRSPFSSLKNMIWLLEQGQLSPEDNQTLLPRLRRQVDTLYSSLDNLLIWSKQQASGQSAQMLPVPVAAIAREMTEAYRMAAQQKQVKLVAPASSSTMAMADVDALRLILRNLLDNAIKFTPSGGCITLQVEDKAEEVALYVQDTGIGMNTGQLNELFTPAGSAVRRGTNGEKGFGVGMQLCRSYAEQSGGTFSVASRPGQGTCFELRLPAACK